MLCFSLLCLKKNKEVVSVGTSEQRHALWLSPVGKGLRAHHHHCGIWVTTGAMEGGAQ